MKYLHIWQNEKFTSPYIKFINKNFIEEEHQFMIIGDGIGAKVDTAKNVSTLYKNKKDIKILLKAMYESKHIYLHGLFSVPIVKLLFLQPWLLKKCRWIIWGGDLYQYRDVKSNLKAKLYEVMRKLIIRNMDYIIALVKGDYVLAQQWYKTKAKYLHGRYINPISYEFLDSLPMISEKNGVFMQIGNSAAITNQHLEALSFLKQYSKENIKIFVPLSYGGTEEYKKEVINYGNKIFGSKFVPMLDFLSSYEYAKYLSSIDIAIFNNNRQQALGNIVALLYLEKKVFIRSDTTMWENISGELGLDVSDTNLISKLSFDQFKDQQANNNRSIIKKMADEKELSRIWNEIFDT